MRLALYFIASVILFLAPSAHSNDPDTLRAASLVYQLAAHWADEGKGRKNFVFDFDYTPEQTLRELSFIYSTAFEELEKGTPIREVMADKEQRLEILYASGYSRFRLVNPLETDWKPFVLELEKRLATWAGSVGLEAFYRPSYAGVYLGFALLEELLSGLGPSSRKDTGGTDPSCGSLMSLHSSNPL